jgi:hypothetical protein
VRILQTGEPPVYPPLIVCLASCQPHPPRLSREQFDFHFGMKTKTLALTIMAIKSSQLTLPFHVGFSAT